MHVLNNVYVWNFFRKLLDIFFGLYKEVQGELRRFGVGRQVSILDVGCGTGQNSILTEGEYLGFDMDCRYIDYARKHFGSDRKRFECQRLQDAKLGDRKYDVSLLNNLLHHISTTDARDLLNSLSKVTNQYLVAFDPVIQRPTNYIGRFLTQHDRGKYIRARQEHLDLISEYFEIVKVRDLKRFFTEGVAVFARPK